MTNLRDKIILMPGFLKFRILKHFKGFTLIEVLIVISIIGVLTGISTVSYTKSQGKTRDTQRKNDLQTIKSALNLYYQQNSQYPPACATHAPDQGCYSTDPQPWIPSMPSVINTLPKDPAQAFNLYESFLAAASSFSLVKPAYAIIGGCGTQAAGLATMSGGQITGISPFCIGSGYSATPYVIINDCLGVPPTRRATATAHLNGDGVDSYNMTDNGQGYTCTPTVNVEPPPGGGPTPTPVPTPGPTPLPTPPPTTGCSTAISANYYYCYSTNAARNRYKIWARLENNSDSEVSTNSSAICYNASPPASLNYCVESE